MQAVLSCQILLSVLEQYTVQNTTFMVKLWFPYIAFFLGGGPHLKEDSLVYSVTDRQRLRTVTAGTIHLRLGVVLRNFEKHGVEFR